MKYQIKVLKRSLIKIHVSFYMGNKVLYILYYAHIYIENLIFKIFFIFSYLNLKTICATIFQIKKIDSRLVKEICQ